MVPDDQSPTKTSSLDTTGIDTEPQKLPHIPTELLPLILENMPAGYILPFRTLCRSLENHIDTSIIPSYLHRMMIIGHTPNYPGPVTFRYSHTSNSPTATWFPDSHAEFCIESKWLDICDEWAKYMPYKSYAKPEIDSRSYWFIQLDEVALGLDTGLTTYHKTRGYAHNYVIHDFDLQDPARTIVLYWKLVLWNMLVWEAEILRRVHAHEGSNAYRIGAAEDADGTSELEFAHGGTRR